MNEEPERGGRRAAAALAVEVSRDVGYSLVSRDLGEWALYKTPSSILPGHYVGVPERFRWQEVDLQKEKVFGTPELDNTCVPPMNGTQNTSGEPLRSSL